MTDLFVIAGSPGSGKTTVGELLDTKLASPYIDFGCIREFHLDREWKTESLQEEQMSFENLVYTERCRRCREVEQACSRSKTSKRGIQNR